MRIVLDCPEPSRTVNAHRFIVRGWVWLGDKQPTLAAVEAWSSATMLGQTGALVLRPDVNAALNLPSSVATGFSFFVGLPAALDHGESDFHLRIRFRDGTRSEPHCTIALKIAAQARPERLDRVEPEIRAAPAADAVHPGTESAPDELPPPHLQTRQVAGVWGPLFYREGRVILNQLAEAFREAGRPLETARAILDFGCGCGRVLWNLQHLAHRAEVWGCDIDPEAIAWNRLHLSRAGQFCVNPALPPTPFRDGQFDAIYSVSVFTHLPEELQFAWLSELRRILAPGGILVASLHGAYCWEKAEPGVKAEVEARGFAYHTGNQTDGLPDFYMTAFHSEAYVRSRWTWFFEFVALKERHIHGLQDAVILRRRDDAS